nr:retrovirus-related Pol polyprotein from transposon TNT 1-94 [Tanacetum cinerariifolium]
EARDYDDALVCCVENTVVDRIIDSVASFHATYCKEELERFKLHSGKRLSDMSVIGMSMLASKGNVPDVRKVKCLKFDNDRGYNSWPIKFCVENRIVMLKIVSETPLQLGVAEKQSRTFRAESMGLCSEASNMLLADSVSTTYLISRIPYVSIWLRIPEEEWRRKDTSLTHLKKSQVVLVVILENLAENESIVAEHGLSSKITQSPGGSSDASEGSKNSGSFEDSGRSNEKYSKEGTSSKVGGSESL